jgi:ornithine carbamoyltransferase
MNTHPPKHLLTGNELNAQSIGSLLNLAEEMQQNPTLHADTLRGKQVAIVFEKPSLRTRLSFMTAVNALGGQAIESISQTRKTEAPKDFIRVIQGYCDAMMIRTFDDHDLQEMTDYANIPIINGLTNHYHPCQTLADLLTLKQCFGSLVGLKIAYIGDGNNILHSLLLMATKMGIQVNYSCPNTHEPNADVLAKLENPALAHAIACPQQAVQGCHAVYTDVWRSMGFEDINENDFYQHQVNEELMAYANENAVFMHCMPMVRGKEVSMSLPDAPCSVIFKQSENRLHVQKALLASLFTKE